MQSSTLAPPASRSPSAVDNTSAQSITARGVIWRRWMVIGSVFAVAVPIAWSGAAPSAPIAADLARLRRMMALLKAAIAIVAMGVVWWCFQFPTRPRLALGYVASSWLMAAGSVVMWQLTHLIAAAVVFHVGLALVLLSGWRDNRTERIG